MSEIRPIEQSSVHRIQSGQVIVDLCSVVKELVENSLDAGATAIDVRFKEHGLESIEVQDNGSGIAKENYESIALKHYTSKLRTYEDLDSLHTFGFRGEALSSLCAVSDVHLLTATAAEAPRGTRLDFNTAGKLTGTQVVAAQRGTLIAVGRLFRTLPVRRQELTKNVKREFAKVVNLLQAYACGSVDVRFAVTNVVGKKKTAVFATKANPTVRENIANVFGARAVAALTSLALEFEMQSSGSRTVRGENRTVQIRGHVSKPVVGEGRQTPDRQMFFVNSRPCNLPQIAKTMNEVYKSYNLNQSPFIFANLILDTNAYDVNVSPDKRQILLHEQGTLLESLKEALTARFDEQQQTVPQSQRPNAKPSPFQSSSLNKSLSTSSPTESPDRSRFRAAPASSSPNNESLRAFSSPIPHHQSPEKPTRQFPQSSPAPKGLLYEFLAPQTQGDRPSNRTEKPSSLPGSNRDALNRTSRVARGAKPTNDDDDLPSTDPPISSEDFDLAEAAASTTRSDSMVEAFNQRKRELGQAEEERPASAVTSRKTEEPIRSLNSSPVKPPPGVVPNAFDRMRPMHTPKQTATITIGDKTIEREIGSDISSRRQGTGRSLKQRSPAQTKFSSSLRAFAAPGSRLEQSDSEHSTKTDRRSSSGERFQPEWPRRGPNRPTGGSRAAQSTITNAFRSQQRLSNSEEVISSDEELVTVGDGIMTHRESIASGSAENGIEADIEAISEPSDDESDAEWLDEDAKRAKEDARVARMIRDAEAKAARPSADDVKRAQNLLRGGHKDAATRLLLNVEANTESVAHQSQQLARNIAALAATHNRQQGGDDSETASAEEKLTLSVSKTDFGRMRIVGQFNLGFILAVRPGVAEGASTDHAADELFIIDQHASDEKFNFERLSATTILQSQRLVHPRALELTAVEREVVAHHGDALTRNGFVVRLHDEDAADDDEGTDNEEREDDNEDSADIAAYNAQLLQEYDEEGEDENGDGADIAVYNAQILLDYDEERYNAHNSRHHHAGPSPRATLLALPASKETTFAPADLEELIALLADGDSGARPSRVRRLLAMRACRSSIMIGRALTHAQMGRIVANLGGLEKPWNCPHGRPTMRHLTALGKEEMWWEGDERGRGGRNEEGHKGGRDSQNEEEEEDEEDDRSGNRSGTGKKNGKVDWSMWLEKMSGTQTEEEKEHGERHGSKDVEEAREDEDEDEDEDEEQL